MKLKFYANKYFNKIGIGFYWGFLFCFVFQKYRNLDRSVLGCLLHA